MAYTETQKENGVTGFGDKVSINGYYAIVSSDVGSTAYFFSKDVDGVWGLINTFTMSGATTSFGKALDIGNAYFVAGDPAYSTNAGKVGVYSINNPGVVLQTISPSVSAGDNFGDAVAISDDYILIGAQGADSSRGDVYLYIKGTHGAWAAYGGNPITPAIRTANDLFGCAVAIRENTLIIGAQGDNNATGAIYIFNKNDATNLWSEVQKILASDGSYNDKFGEAISASGDYFVTGASMTESASGDLNAGSAYVYKYSTSWYEVDKLTGIDESSYEGNHFGESVDINGDYIIIGSPAARGTIGVTDVFYKKRSWGHLKKIVGSDSVVADDFGESVGISNRSIIVGASRNAGAGSVYFYEDLPIRLRLAQEFDVNAEYLPSKASVYLKRVGKNTTNYWLLYNTSGAVIDATNFSTISYGGNITTFADNIPYFTGNGYMILMGDSASAFTTVNYPVRAVVADTFNLWIRCITTDSTTFQADILIDGVQIKTINETVSNPSDVTWDWINTTIVLPDTREHNLGIRIKESGAAFDKIYIDASNVTPYLEGPDYGESPYLTVHMRVYHSSAGSPDDPLYIYDYKNSITQIVQSDWYNFNISVLDSSRGHTLASDFTDSYFLVMLCSGTTHDNFVIWEMADNDEYRTSPSAFIF